MRLGWSIAGGGAQVLLPKTGFDLHVAKMAE